MEWRSGGVDGGLFRADALARPGWYWVLRPRNEGERRYDAQVGILLPVLVRGDERVVSPLADLRDTQPIPATSRHTCATTKVTAKPMASGNRAATVVHRRLPVSLYIV